MRKVILAMFVTVDGFIEGPDQEMDWNIGNFDEAMEEYADEQIEGVDTLLLGRRTYEVFVGYWPEQTGAFADKMNGLEKIVFSRALERTEWVNSRVAADAVKEVEDLKARPGGHMLIYGSAELAQGLMRRGLIDEYRLWVHPIVLGAGRSLFGDLGERIGLTLAETRVFDTGVCVLRYEKA
ncbi:dihydrofolate reductase family protein [Sphaerisporangium corydalis]|uniref:Dihydrofolate reductase family protein n=1 Tax=Sphaerisporangium corydalis TaxID=1441875 RepID=A0ABV9EBK4_9ACTN|nr:dihydrofolate reductase family protein [Sphaerisporangium corydalis]